MSWLDQESKVSWPILDFGVVLDISVPVRMFDVTNRAESWKEAVRDIDGDRLAREQVSDILVDEVSEGGVFKLDIESLTISRMSRWWKDPLHDKLISEWLRNFHLAVKKLNDGDRHGFSVVIHVVLGL
jgi:hypothetical protein